MVLNETERALHKGLMKILDEGTFPLKAREVPAFAQIYAWVKSLADKKDEPIKVKKK